MFIKHSVNSDWLFNNQSRVLQSDWSIMEINEKATLHMNKAYWSMNNWIHKKNDDKNNQYINIRTSKIKSSDTLCGQLTVGFLKFLGHQNNADLVEWQKNCYRWQGNAYKDNWQLWIDICKLPWKSFPCWPFLFYFLSSSLIFWVDTCLCLPTGPCASLTMLSRTLDLHRLIFSMLNMF